jgi:branched-subunit amino acid aminotransferase/4-amino-4-deoxychorismate lyase
MNIGVFTTLKVTNNVPLFFNKHHERLVSQAKKLNVGSMEISEEAVQNYLKKNNLRDCALKITVTKQNGKTTITYQPRTQPMTLTSCKVITIEDTRNYLKIYKTTNRTINNHAKKLASEKGADDALFVNDGNIVESTISNVFGLNKKGEMITPLIRAKGLNGITRQLIMEHTKVIETDIKQNTNGPLVLVNALRVQKVTHVNGKKLVDGEKLMHRLRTIIDAIETAYLSNFSV